MTNFWVLSFRNLWARKTRTLVTASGILLGVAAMLAVGILSASTTQSLKDFFAQSSGRANLTISEANSSGEGFPRRILQRLQQFTEVTDAVGLTMNQVTLLTQEKTVSLMIIGIDPASDRRVRTYKVLDGQFLAPNSKTHNILLVKKFADEHQIAVNDALTTQLSNGNSEKFKVIGLIGDEGAGRLNGGTIGFISLDVAQTVFERGSRLDQVDLVAQPEIANDSASLKEVKTKLASELGNTYTVAYPASTGESISQAMGGLYIGLGFFGVIALFVGMLLIYNTFAMTLAERTREIGMLRSLGATKWQVLRLVLSEALTLGVIGTILGIGGGMLLAIPLVTFMSGMIGLPLENFLVPMGDVIQAAVVGLITTVIAAMIPAWQASRISPTEAMRARAGGREGFLMRHSWKFGLGLVVIAALDGSGVVRLGEGPQFFILLFLGSILLMPTVILLMERLGRGLIAAIYGHIGHLGSQNLARSKWRTSLTVGVLMIGVVMNVAIGAMSVSFKASMDDWVNAAIGGDFIVSSSEMMREEMGKTISNVNGVEAVTPERLLQNKVIGSTNREGFVTRDDSILFVGIDPETYLTVSSFQFGDGETTGAAMAELTGGNVVFLSTTLRDRWKVGGGDTVRLRTTRGERDFRVAATVVTFWQGGQSLFMSRRDLEKYFSDTRVNLFLVKKAKGASSAEVQTRLKEALGNSKRFDIQVAEEFRKTISAQILQFFSLFDAMVWIAVIVGALGVVNTMTMNVLERVREIGTLRSVGLTRGQLTRMILAEAGAMGVLGAVFGVAIALPVSFVMVEGMRQGSGFQVTYTFPSWSFVAGVIIAMIVSQVAALYPSWRAGQVSVVKAIQGE